MRDLCIPIPNLVNDDSAELQVKIVSQNMVYEFRIESFTWFVDELDETTRAGEPESLIKINKLREAIKNYDKNWELIQIYTPDKDAKYIKVLYRKKQ